MFYIKEWGNKDQTHDHLALEIWNGYHITSQLSEKIKSLGKKNMNGSTFNNIVKLEIWKETKNNVMCFHSKIERAVTYSFDVSFWF
jgi:hypothetical protein